MLSNLVSGCIVGHMFHFNNVSFKIVTITLYCLHPITSNNVKIPL